MTGEVGPELCGQCVGNIGPVSVFTAETLGGQRTGGKTGLRGNGYFRYSLGDGGGQLADISAQQPEGQNEK